MFGRLEVLINTYIPAPSHVQLTEVYASIDDFGSFAIGRDVIEITNGNQFILLAMTVEQDYEDLLTCSSDTSSETAKLRIVAGLHYHSSGNFVCKDFSLVNIHLVNFKSFCTVPATFNSLVNFVP